MIKRVNLLDLQRVADKLPRKLAETIEAAIQEIAAWRGAMRAVNDLALDALSEPLELQHFPGGGFGPKLPPRTTTRIKPQPSKNAETDYVKRA